MTAPAADSGSHVAGDAAAKQQYADSANEIMTDIRHVTSEITQRSERVQRTVAYAESCIRKVRSLLPPKTTFMQQKERDLAEYRKHAITKENEAKTNLKEAHKICKQIEVQTTSTTGGHIDDQDLEMIKSMREKYFDVVEARYEVDRQAEKAEKLCDKVKTAAASFLTANKAKLTKKRQLAAAAEAAAAEALAAHRTLESIKESLTGQLLQATTSLDAATQLWQSFRANVEETRTALQHPMSDKSTDPVDQARVRLSQAEERQRTAVEAFEVSAANLHRVTSDIDAASRTFARMRPAIDDRGFGAVLTLDAPNLSYDDVEPDTEPVHELESLRARIGIQQQKLTQLRDLKEAAEELYTTTVEHLQQIQELRLQQQLDAKYARKQQAFHALVKAAVAAAAARRVTALKHTLQHTLQTALHSTSTAAVLGASKESEESARRAMATLVATVQRESTTPALPEESPRNPWLTSSLRISLNGENKTSVSAELQRTLQSGVFDLDTFGNLYMALKFFFYESQHARLLNFLITGAAAKMRIASDAIARGGQDVINVLNKAETSDFDFKTFNGKFVDALLCIQALDCNLLAKVIQCIAKSKKFTEPQTAALLNTFMTQMVKASELGFSSKDNVGDKFSTFQSTFEVLDNTSAEFSLADQLAVLSKKWQRGLSVKDCNQLLLCLYDRQCQRLNAMLKTQTPSVRDMREELEHDLRSLLGNPKQHSTVHEQAATVVAQYADPPTFFAGHQSRRQNALGVQPARQMTTLEKLFLMPQSKKSRLWLRALGVVSAGAWCATMASAAHETWSSQFWEWFAVGCVFTSYLPIPLGWSIGSLLVGPSAASLVFHVGSRSLSAAAANMALSHFVQPAMSSLWHMLTQTPIKSLFGTAVKCATTTSAGRDRSAYVVLSPTSLPSPTSSATELYPNNTLNIFEASKGMHILFPVVVAAQHPELNVSSWEALRPAKDHLPFLVENNSSLMFLIPRSANTPVWDKAAKNTLQSDALSKSSSLVYNPAASANVAVTLHSSRLHLSGVAEFAQSELSDDDVEVYAVAPPVSMLQQDDKTLLFNGTPFEIPAELVDVCKPSDVQALLGGWVTIETLLRTNPLIVSREAIHLVQQLPNIQPPSVAGMIWGMLYHTLPHMVQLHCAINSQSLFSCIIPDQVIEPVVRALGTGNHQNTTRDDNDGRAPGDIALADIVLETVVELLQQEQEEEPSSSFRSTSTAKPKIKGVGDAVLLDRYLAKLNTAGAVTNVTRALGVGTGGVLFANGESSIKGIIGANMAFAAAVALQRGAAELERLLSVQNYLGVQRFAETGDDRSGSAGDNIAQLLDFRPNQAKLLYGITTSPLQAKYAHALRNISKLASDWEEGWASRIPVDRDDKVATAESDRKRALASSSFLTANAMTAYWVARAANNQLFMPRKHVEAMVEACTDTALQKVSSALKELEDKFDTKMPQMMFTPIPFCAMQIFPRLPAAETRSLQFSILANMALADANLYNGTLPFVFVMPPPGRTRVMLGNIDVSDKPLMAMEVLAAYMVYRRDLWPPGTSFLAMPVGIFTKRCGIPTIWDEYFAMVSELASGAESGEDLLTKMNHLERTNQLSRHQVTMFWSVVHPRDFTALTHQQLLHFALNQDEVSDAIAIARMGQPWPKATRQAEAEANKMPTAPGDDAQGPPAAAGSDTATGPTPVASTTATQSPGTGSTAATAASTTAPGPSPAASVAPAGPTPAAPAVTEVSVTRSAAPAASVAATGSDAVTGSDAATGSTTATGSAAPAASVAPESATGSATPGPGPVPLQTSRLRANNRGRSQSLGSQHPA
jgi:hypothetical protein